MATPAQEARPEVIEARGAPGIATPAQDARREVIEARGALGAELDELSAAARSAVDIPAKIKRNPIQTAALAGGAGFLLVGGPKRVLKAVGRRIRPPKPNRYDGILPHEVEGVLKKRAGSDAPEIKAALEEDFAAYLNRKKGEKPPPSTAASLLKTYDSLIGPIASVASRQLIDRLFAADKGRPNASAEGRPPADAGSGIGKAGGGPGTGKGRGPGGRGRGTGRGGLGGRGSGGGK